MICNLKSDCMGKGVGGGGRGYGADKWWSKKYNKIKKKEIK